MINSVSISRFLAVFVLCVYFFELAQLSKRFIGRKIFWILTLPLFILLSSCGGGGASGGEQTEFSPVVDFSGGTFRVNNIEGSDLANGSDQAFQTLQHAFDQLRPGDTLIIEQTVQPYSSAAVIKEERDFLGVVIKTLRGFQLSQSGTADFPIVIEGRGVNPPVIDQGRSSSSSNEAFLGILLDCVSHVTIRNLEIRNVNEAGISSAFDGVCETNDVVIENNNIHHVYGEKYVGGIRMMGVNNLVARDNYIHDIFSNQTAEAKLFVNNDRGLSGIVIEGNTIDQVVTGVAINNQGIGAGSYTSNPEELIDGLQITDNIFDTVGQAVALRTEIVDNTITDELNTGAFNHIDIYGNIVHLASNVLVASLGNSEYQSNNVCIFNNTFVDVVDEGFDISGVTNLQNFNNIFSSPFSEILITRSPSNPLLRNSIAYSDNNLFTNFTQLSWVLDNRGSAETSYPNLLSWQMAETHPELSINPDQFALLIDPVFINELDQNFNLSAGSPAIGTGRFGMSIGADFSLPANADLIINPCIERIR